MHIAIISDYFLDYVGGAQTSMLQQQHALTESGHDVLLVAASRGLKAPATEDASGLRIKPALTLPGFELPVVGNTSALRRRLREAFERHGVEAVHVQTEFGLAHAAADVARDLGLPLVHTVHTFYWASDGSWHAPIAPLLRTLLRRITGTPFPRVRLSPRPVDNLLRNLTLAMAKRADIVVSPSAHQARDLAAAGVTGRIEVVPNPIATSSKPSSPLTNAAAEHPSFLWVARCESVKRPLVFAEAAVAALTANPGSFTVDFVGDGSELATLRSLVAGRPEIRVHGNLPHEDVLDLMDASALVVLTSLGFDNQPMTIAEAVSRERGVLYCDPKLSEGLAQSGHCSPTPDAAGLAKSLTELSRDPSMVLELSRGAHADMALFDPKRYVERITGLYAG
jgi:glycosyltransferase involved in cell wall biosynthesis